MRSPSRLALQSSLVALGLAAGFAVWAQTPPAPKPAAPAGRPGAAGSAEGLGTEIAARDAGCAGAFKIESWSPASCSPGSSPGAL